MGRLRNGKGSSSRPAGTPKPAFSKKLSMVESTDDKQVLALGGIQDDIGLLKNVDDAVAGPSTHDVRFIFDLYTFESS